MVFGPSVGNGYNTDTEDNGADSLHFSFEYSTSTRHDDGYDADNKDNDIDDTVSASCFSLQVTSTKHNNGYNAVNEDI